MYKLLINQTMVWTGTGILQLVSEIRTNAKTGDKVEVYRKARTQWQLEDGGIWTASPPSAPKVFGSAMSDPDEFPYVVQGVLYDDVNSDTRQELQRMPLYQFQTREASLGEAEAVKRCGLNWAPKLWKIQGYVEEEF